MKDYTLVEDYMSLKTEVEQLKKEVSLLKKEKQSSFYNFLWKVSKDVVFSVGIGYIFNSWIFVPVLITGSQFFS